MRRESMLWIKIRNKREGSMKAIMGMRITRERTISPREMEKWWGRVLISGSDCELEENGARGW